MSKILVTGGAGFIGTNLIELLVKKGHSVTSVDNYDSGFTTNHIKDVTYIDYDIIDVLDYSAWGEFEVIFHLGAISRIQPSFEDPLTTFKVNVLGTQNICEYARKHNCKVIYAGSSSKHHDPYQSPYAAYKYLGEEVCKLYKTTYGLDAEIARFYNVYGPGEIVDGDWAAVIGIWRRQSRDNELLTIVGDGEQRRDFTHVCDIVDGFYKIAFGGEKHDDAWELGSGVNYSMNEVYKMFHNKFNVGCLYIPEQPGNYKSTLRLDDDALTRLNWKPKDRLKKYINEL